MLLNTQHLKEWLGCSHTKKIISFLNSRSIPYWIEKGQPLTTTEAINKKLIGEPETDEEVIEFTGHGQKA